MEPLRVECRREDGDAPVPVRFGWPGSMREVTEVIDRWPGDDYEYVRVRAGDDAVYILRHDSRDESWELVFFETERPL